MEYNAVRNSLVERLDVEDLKYDIQRLSAELYRHKSKTMIFEETLKAQKTDLDAMLDTKQHHLSEGGIYQ